MSHEDKEQHVFPELLDRVEFFVDVGTNKGIYTLVAAASGCIRRVMAIEFDPVNAADLSQNAKK